MQNSTNMRILELLRFLYERTDENHPATVSDIIAHLNGKGIQAVRQTVYADTNALIDAGIDIVVVKSTQNQYFMGSRLFEYDRKREAIFLLSLCLFGYAVPELQEELEMPRLYPD